jgi:hypothetical protein
MEQCRKMLCFYHLFSREAVPIVKVALLQVRINLPKLPAQKYTTQLK